MKTRADIYGQEAAELLREISMYPGLNQFPIPKQSTVPPSAAVHS